MLFFKTLFRAGPLFTRLQRSSGLAACIAVALTLPACVESSAPIITNAKPLLGQQFNVHLYEDFSEGRPRNFHAASYRWANGEYVRASGFGSDAKRFVAEPLAGNDFVIQSTDEQARRFVFWIGRKLHDGTYLVFPLHMMDADEATRKTTCGGEQAEVCRIATREHLAVMARASAAQAPRDPVLGVVVAR